MPSPENSHNAGRIQRAFLLGILLNVAFIGVEIVFGLLADSLALLADAGHNLSDVLGLLLAWGATYLSRRRPTQSRTYGWRKSSVLAALFNAVILLIAIGGIAWEAVQRFSRPAPVAGMTIIWVAAVGLVINSLTALLFMSDRKQDLNIRGAFLHMTADAGVSAGVVAVGAGIFFTGWFWLDPVVSLVIVLIILAGTASLFIEAFNLALDAVPGHIDTPAVRRYLEQLPGVSHVHDLHIWAMSTTEVALTAHLIKLDTRNDDEMLMKIQQALDERFGIGHATIQWERSRRVCGIEAGPIRDGERIS